MTRTGWQKTWVRVVTTLLTAMVLVMIYCFSMENAEQSDKRSGVISLTIISVLHPDYGQMDEIRQQAVYDETQHVVRKCAHFLEYMALGFMARLCLESWFGHKVKKKWLLALIGFGAGTAYACTDEMHQLRIDGRSGQWTDVLVDGCGVLAGAALGTFVVSIVNRRAAEKA